MRPGFVCGFGGVGDGTQTLCTGNCSNLGSHPSPPLLLHPDPPLPAVTFPLPLCPALPALTTVQPGTNDGAIRSTCKRPLWALGLGQALVAVGLAWLSVLMLWS